MKHNYILGIVRLLALQLFLFCTVPVYAQWNSYILSFDKNQFGKGAQTWQIDTFDEKWVYFANRNGMLEFDGNVWKQYQMKNALDARSVLVSSKQKRIYVGGINEFGYYEPNSTGTLIYHCMTDSLDDASRLLGNVWGIHESDHILYFQGDDRLVKYVDGKCTIIKSDAKIDCSSLVNGVLYIGTEHGVYFLAGTTFLPIEGKKEQPMNRIRGIVPFNKGVMIVTAYHGLYYWDGHSLEKFHTEAEKFICSNEVFCVDEYNGKIALGTIQKGIILIDTEQNEIKYFNENNGLHNNTVLSVAFDKSGNLWAGLDNGIDYVCLNIPYSNLYTYPHFYGTGYTAALDGDMLYLGTNRGLYHTQYPVRQNGDIPDIRFIAHSGGQVWNLCRVGDDLFCMHDRGVFLVRGTELKRVTDITGVWTCQLVKGHVDCLYVGAYDGIYLLKKVNGVWQNKGKIKGFTDSSKLFVQESHRVIWIHNTNHILRIELNSILSEAVNQREFDAIEGLPVSRDTQITLVNDKIYFMTSKGTYQYNKVTQRIEACPNLNALLEHAKNYRKFREHHHALIGLSPNGIAVTRTDAMNHARKVDFYPIKRSLIELVPSFENFIPLTDSLIVVPNVDGFSLFKIPDKQQYQNLAGSLVVNHMYLSYPKDSLVYCANFLGRKPYPEIDYDYNSVRFDYDLSQLMLSDEMRFQYRLNGEKWSEPTTLKTKEYSNLADGKYKFEVKAIFPDGTISHDCMEFSVLSPWYQTITAYVFYVVLFLFLLYLLYHWDDRRVKRKEFEAVVEQNQRMEKMEKDYEEEKARQEKQIMQLEKEKLEHDLQYKSQEIANLMINFVRKNETLTEIKAEIMKVVPLMKGEGTSEVKKQLLLINSRIDSNMQSDEMLKRIEEQFDLVHNNFMKILQEKHPDLSNSERMMCAYLKMNLSTKEIAPMLNISVRGVETVRYRLRKKFGLERQDNLTDYLNKLQ